MIAITLRFFSEVDEEQNTAHDVLLPSSGVLMISGVIVAGGVVKAESNDKNQFIFLEEEINMYTSVGRYCTPKLCAHSYQSECAHNLLLYVQYRASVCTLLPIGIAFSITIHLPQVRD